MNRCSTLLIGREMQIKTKVRYHFTPTKIAIVTKMENKCQQGCGEIRTISITDRKVKWYGLCGKRNNGFSKIKQTFILQLCSHLIFNAETI